MSNITLIIGESGTGKSTSIRTLNEKETFIINVIDKPLPFREFKSKYKKITKASEGNCEGNYFASDDANKIVRMIHYISDKIPTIKNIIIDDYQYIMANEFMRRATDKGFDKFTEIGRHGWEIIENALKCRDDLYIFFLSHSETDNLGRAKCKTIGKMIDDKITLEGMFTTVLHSIINDGKYMFLTQNDGTHIAKSPMSMFDTLTIANDLNAIKDAMINYYEGNQNAI